MQKEINYIEKWDRKGRSYTWSGTSYGLFQALEKEGIKIIDVPINGRPLDKLNYYFRRLFLTLRKKNDFEVSQIRQTEKQLAKSTRMKANIPSLMFTQYRSKYIKDSYVFIDFSVQYLLELRKNQKELMDFTPLNNGIPEKYVSERNAIVEEWTRECRGIFTMSSYLAKDFTERLGIPEKKVHYVGGGCNVDISRIDGSQRDGNRFLFVGRDWERKNGPLVVEAFSGFHKKFPKTELYILGPAVEPSEVKEKEGIHFVGPTSYQDTLRYYNLCDYFVMPSRCEAYGLVFGEALIFGLPCIAKNAFAMPEFIEDDTNGYLIEHDDVDELCAAMEKMLLNSKRLKETVESNRTSYAERYSWKTVAKKMIAVMEADGYWKNI
ncbi:MAG: glycosyltransferase family 4 protein [Lachnospiraceae bacterium]|nr:glycosyltransferase family 4 protein [Lachnospiraceae bacterium]